MGPIGFSVEQQNLLWAMWRRGDSIPEMERTLGETLPGMRRFLRQSVRIPLVPRQRGGRDLARDRGRPGGTLDRGTHRSTVIDGVARDRPQWGRDGYRALAADAGAFERARRPKVSKLAANVELAGVVAAKLDEDWSPQQIAEWLRRVHPGDAGMWVSHESIYRDVYMPSRKAFDARMFHRLRGGRSIRRPLGKRFSHGRGQLRNTVSIRERPVEADVREVGGHWDSQCFCQAA